MTSTLEVDQLLASLHPIMLEIMFPLVNVDVVVGEGDVSPVAARAVAMGGRGGPGREGCKPGCRRGRDGRGRGRGSGRFC